MTNGVYAAAGAYDLAFSYRDCAAQVAEFLRWYQAIRPNRQAPGSALEMAFGPGRHLLALARHGVLAIGIDLAPEMCAYCAKLAESEASAVTGIPEDMVSFELGRRFDLVLLLLNSISHILDEASLGEHFESASAHMTEDAIYIVESSRTAPGEEYGKHSWRESNSRGEIAVTWESRPGMERARLAGTIDGIPFDVEDEFPMRQWRTSEILRAAQAGRLELVAIAGDFDQDPPSPFAGASLPTGSGLHPCFVFGKHRAAAR